MCVHFFNISHATSIFMHGCQVADSVTAVAFWTDSAGLDFAIVILFERDKI